MVYLQYNDLVFEKSKITSDTTNTSFKSFEEDKAYTHGVYSPDIEYELLESGNITISSTWNLNSLNNEVKQFFKQYVISRITKRGILWAYDNKELLWANVKVVTFDVYESTTDVFKCDIEFRLIDGYYHKADNVTTYLMTYCLPEYMATLELKKIDYCNGCFIDITSNKCISGECCNYLALCDVDISDIDLCYPQYLFALDTCCIGGYKIKSVLDGECSVSENMFVDTDIATECDVVLRGHMQDILVKINDVSLMLKGDYKGTLTYKANGDLWYNDGYCDKLISPKNVINLVENGEYFYTIKPFKNSVYIQRSNNDKTMKINIINDRRTI